MTKVNGFDTAVHIGRCRCEKHAKDYVRQVKKPDKIFYYVPRSHIPEEMLCTTCLRQGKQGKVEHGGLVISKEALEHGVAILGPFPGFQLVGRQKENATQIWPEG